MMLPFNVFFGPQRCFVNFFAWGATGESRQKNLFDTRPVSGAK